MTLSRKFDTYESLTPKIAESLARLYFLRKFKFLLLRIFVYYPIILETFGAARVNGDRIRDFFADPSEYLWQYNNMKTEYKTMCVDTGHTHEAGSFWVPPAEEMIRILGKDISLLHLHDNSGHWDDHMLPGMGTINWPAVFDALDDISYEGNYNFEIRTNCFGDYLEEYIRFVGKYVRNFVDKRGRI